MKDTAAKKGEHYTGSEAAPGNTNQVGAIVDPSVY